MLTLGVPLKDKVVEEDQINLPVCTPGAFIRHHKYEMVQVQRIAILNSVTTCRIFPMLQIYVLFYTTHVVFLDSQE